MVLISPDPPLLEFIKCGSHSFWVSLLLICLTNEFRYTTLSLNCKVIIQVKPNLRYTHMVVGPAMHAVYAKAEKVPFFYAIFKALFGMVTRKSDAWVRDLAAQKGQFTLDIHQCLWYDTRCACGAPEACRFFCACDNYTYGDLKKVALLGRRLWGQAGANTIFGFTKSEGFP